MNPLCKHKFTEFSINPEIWNSTNNVHRDKRDLLRWLSSSKYYLHYVHLIRWDVVPEMLLVQRLLKLHATSFKGLLASLSLWLNVVASKGNSGVEAQASMEASVQGCLQTEKNEFSYEIIKSATYFQMQFYSLTAWKPRWNNYRSGIITYHHSHWPIVQVDNVGSLAELRQEFQCCTWEVGEPIKVIRLIVNALAAKKVFWVKRINEIHNQALHNATPHCILVHSSVKVRVELPAQYLHKMWIWHGKLRISLSRLINWPTKSWLRSKLLH